MAFLHSFIIVVLCCAIASNALPFFQKKRAIQASQLQTFKLMREYASAAYCPSNFNSPGDQITCAGGSCSDVEAADSATVVEYDRQETSTDVAGYVAVDHTNKLIIVSFRGSTTIDAWLTDFDFATTNTDICSGCTAHSGFWQSWLDARDLVVPAVKQSVAKYPSYKVTVVGHSLGAAIASLAAASLRNSGLIVAMYNFGSPRIGGTKISSYISNQPGGNYRFTHGADPVPKVPLLTMGYVHISPEYYINTPDGQGVGANDIQTINGAINLFKGNQANLWPDIVAHQWYFGAVYTCSGKNIKRGKLQIRGVEEEVDLVTTF